jgi:large subunit ribosomal protein L17
MRHAKKTIKLGRKSEHRNLLLANQVCSLIEYNRIKTTLAKAKAVRPFAERMITLGKRGDLHARRVAFSFLRQKEAVRRLFAELAPRTASRQGGYCRIVKLGPRQSDSALMAYLEFVDQPGAEAETKLETKTKSESKTKSETKAKPETKTKAAAEKK